MNRSRVLSARSLIALFVPAALTATVAAQVVEPPLSKPTEPTRDSRSNLYWGTVTEVTKTSISIQWSSDEKPKTFAVSETLAAGKTPIKPREFVIPNHRAVPGDRFVPPSFMYRLTDVKVGDLVAIWYAHLGEQNICDQICIQKRPGGLVPPLPKEAEDLLNPAERFKAKFPGKPLDPVLQEWQDKYIPYHEKMNAHWDLEDKGIP
jgi:hypothetical protein